MKTYLITETIKDTLIILGTGYVVFGLGRSPWWFLLAFGFLAVLSVSYKKKTD